MQRSGTTGDLYEAVLETQPSTVTGASATTIQRSARASATFFWVAMAAVTLVSLAWRQNGATSDVSWLTSMCRRILDGETGWIDIFETTPPVPTLLYMPGVVLSRLFGISAEITVFATAYAAALGALAYTLRLLPERIAGSGPSRWVVIFPAAVFLFILSDGAFAQREYFAAAFSLPMFAVFVRHVQEEAWPNISDRLIAAALAGFAFAIKPPIFALPFIMLAVYELARTRSLAFLFPSMLPVAAATGVILTALSLAAFPAYLDGVTTLMRDVYVPIHGSPMLAINFAFIGTAFCLVASMILSSRSDRSLAGDIARIFAAAFLVVYIIQGKYFSYHAQPAALFACIAFAIPLYGKAKNFFGKSNPGLADATFHGIIAVLAVTFLAIGFEGKKPLMRDIAWADDLDNPTALAISTDISVGFPLAEHLGARWVDRIHSQWVAKYTRIALSRDGLGEAEKERYQSYFDRDIERTRMVIQDKAPDLIIQLNHPEAAWLTEALLEGDPALLDNYEIAAEEGVIRVLRRRDVGRKAATGGAAGLSGASVSP